jgi:tRNA(Ile2)-agmatinylcytidine synthase
MSEAKKTLKHCGGEGIGYGSAIGIIGALGAIGTPLRGDHTYEFLAYRKQENRGSKRRVDSDSVFNMDKTSGETTFSNVDEEQKRVLITPRGPDPVLLGIRGETPAAVRRAFLQISLDEDLERWAIFRTNQGTDLHLPPIMDVANTEPRCPASIEGIVSKSPCNIAGKHVVFQVKDTSGEIHVAAYEPSGDLRKTVRSLIVGDRIRVYGGIRPAEREKPATVNLEKLEILELSEETISENPVCPTCGKRMESMGTNGGYRCRHCGLRDPHGEKTIMQKKRMIELGIYLPPPRSQRHLAKPLIRYGRERPYLEEIPRYFWGLSYPDQEI